LDAPGEVKRLYRKRREEKLKERKKEPIPGNLMTQVSQNRFASCCRSFFMTSF
jgi:hypothetical protein